MHYTDLSLVLLAILTIFHSITWAMVSVKAGLAQYTKLYAVTQKMKLNMNYSHIT